MAIIENDVIRRKRFDKAVKKILKTKNSMLNFLVKAKIVDKNGELYKLYKL